MPTKGKREQWRNEFMTGRVDGYLRETAKQRGIGLQEVKS